MQRNPHRRHTTMATLQSVLSTHHPAVRVYKHAFELTETVDLPYYRIRLTVDPSTDRRRYNLPTSQTELAAIIPNDGPTSTNAREIIVRPRGGGLMRMGECHPAFFSLHFLLLSPSGQLSWQPNTSDGHRTEQTSETEGEDPSPQKRHSLTLSKYAQYRLHARPSDVESDHLFRAKLLLQEFVVLTWAAAEHGCRT